MSSESSTDLLWEEYGRLFRDFDDLSLARWLCQTLGQLDGKASRLSHPLVGAYRLAAQAANDRQLWLKRIATPPASYPDAPCCRSPLLAIFSRDVRESGLVCMHCNETAVPWEDLPNPLRTEVGEWAALYNEHHAIAHWDEAKRKAAPYDQLCDQAAEKAIDLLRHAREQFLGRLLEIFPAIVWEDQDECLGVRPEDLPSEA